MRIRDWSSDVCSSDLVECGKEVGRAVAPVIVALPLRLSGTHRQYGGGALDGLDLGLLIDTQDERPIGRVEVEADDIADLVDEQRIGREFEGLMAVRLQAEGAPGPAERRLAHPGRSEEQ